MRNKNGSLEEILEKEMSLTIGEVSEYVEIYRRYLTTDQFRGKFDECTRRSYHSQLYNRRSSMRVKKDYWNCWGLQYMDFKIKTKTSREFYLSSPRSLSIAISLGMMKVNLKFEEYFLLEQSHFIFFKNVGIINGK